MFRTVSKPPLPAEAGLLALCPSLNSPVLNSDDLPVGPARAAILVYAEEYGDLRVSVAVRSIATGDIQAFVYRGRTDDLADAGQAMDMALTFAEGMGFLFDDDWVPRQGKAAAVDLWAEITGAGVPAEAGADDDLELEELELSEESPFELATDPGFERELAVEPEPSFELELAALELDQPVAEERPVAASAPTLTKFRRPPEKKAQPRKTPASPAKDAATTGSELGRIALVRKRLGGGPEPTEKRSLLLRLLGQF